MKMRILALLLFLLVPLGSAGAHSFNPTIGAGGGGIAGIPGATDECVK